MKDPNLSTPELHDFNDLAINVSKITAIIGFVAAYLVRQVVRRFDSRKAISLQPVTGLRQVRSPTV